MPSPVLESFQPAAGQNPFDTLLCVLWEVQACICGVMVSTCCMLWVVQLAGWLCAGVAVCARSFAIGFQPGGLAALEEPRSGGGQYPPAIAG